jgi:hypothetical protein
MQPTVRCPECGAQIEIRSPAAVLVVCSYCRAAVHWNAQAVESAGKQSALAEGFTRLYRGALGWALGQRFEVVGRVRYSHRSGVWDEWFVNLEGHRTAWITEDDHELALQDPLTGVDLSFVRSLRAGQRFRALDTEFEVDEAGETVCVGIDGELPKTVVSGQRYRYVDATSLDGTRALGVELDQEPPTAFVGRWLAHDDLRLDDEGEQW